jgi:hypothetical protein
MGVQIYVLDRRPVTLLVDGAAEKIGTARSFWKVTEMDKERGAEIDAVKASLRGKPAPVAVMIAAVSELPLASAPGRDIAAHLVLGWDEDRASVTDFAWDYLPVLGYAVKTADAADYTLHEERDGLLHHMTKSRALELGILDAAGELVRRGQPSIIECRAVKPYISVYAEADCLLSDGRAVEILTSIEAGNLPAPAWYAGKRPADVAAFPAHKAA